METCQYSTIVIVVPSKTNLSDSTSLTPFQMVIGVVGELFDARSFDVQLLSFFQGRFSTFIVWYFRNLPLRQDRDLGAVSVVSVDYLRRPWCLRRFGNEYTFCTISSKKAFWCPVQRFLNFLRMKEATNSMKSALKSFLSWRNSLIELSYQSFCVSTVTTRKPCLRFAPRYSGF